jgi:hypothetical protein
LLSWKTCGARGGPFTGLFAATPRIDGISDGERSYEFFNLAVTGDYFSALGIQPTFGRFFQPGEGESPGAEINVVLGHSFWQKKFGADATIVGRQLHINGKAATVIGMAPEDFHGTYAGADFDGYLPLRSEMSEDYAWERQFFSDRKERHLTVFGRLKPRVHLEQAQEFMTAFAQHQAQQYSETDQGIGIRVLPEPRARPVPLRFLRDAVPFIRFFLLLLAGMVLLLACLNVANIMLVRGTVARTRDGDSHGSWFWPPSSDLRNADGKYDSGFGWRGCGNGRRKRAIRAFASSLDFGTNLPVFLDFSFDWRVFVYGLAAAVITGIGVGLWPAMRASRTDGGAALHDGSRSNSGGATRQRARSLLVVGQVAGSLVLLVGAGLFLRSLQNANRIDLGFTPDNILNATLNPQWAGYSVQRSKEFFRELRRRVDAWPEVRSSSLALSVPLGLINSSSAIYMDGRPVPGDQQIPIVGSNYIDGDYFQTMQIPIVHGRAFRESDTDGAPRVAIINQTMAKRYWPNEDAIGKRFHPYTPDRPLTEVVGIAKGCKVSGAV